MTTQPHPEPAGIKLAYAVLDLNTGWNAKETESLIADRIDLCRRLAVRCISSVKREAEPLTQLECEMLPVWQDAAPWSGAGRLRIARAIEAAHGIVASQVEPEDKPHD